MALDVIVRENSVALAAGGTCCNVLAILGALGWAAMPVARLNGDRAASLIKLDLSAIGLDLSFTSETPEAVAPVIIERVGGKAGRDHSFSFRCAVCAGWLPQYRPLTRASAASVEHRLPEHDVYFFDRVAPSSLALAQSSARRGALVYFEPSAPGEPEMLSRGLRVAHVAKYSSQRIRSLAEADTKHLALEIVTLGADGVRYRRRAGGWRSVAGPPLDHVVDSAGAGDWFSAALLHLIGAGPSELDRCSDGQLTDAIAAAQEVAAWSCGFVGARGAMVKGAAERVPVLAKLRRAEPLESSGSLASEMRQLCKSCSQDSA